MDLKRVLEISHGMETAAKDIQDLTREMPLDRSMNKLHRFGLKDESKECYRCGGKHDQAKCRFKKEKCYICDKFGHIAKWCRKPMNFRKKEGRTSVNINLMEQNQSDKQLAYNLFNFKDEDKKPYRENLTLNAIMSTWKIDTGASFSVMNEKTFQQIIRDKENVDLKQTEISLRSYTGEKISPKGITEVLLEYNDKATQLSILVLKGNGSNLIGRNWLKSICLIWKTIKRFVKPNLGDLLKKYDNSFIHDFSELKGARAKIYVKPFTKPIFCKARSVPYAMKIKIERELEWRECRGIIKNVQYSD